MAHSIQKYGGRYLALNDLDIVSSVLLLKRIADEHGDEHLTKLAMQWEQALVDAGPGTIDLRLNEIGRLDEDRRRLCDGLVTLRRKADSFGDTIPGSVLGPSSFGGVVLSTYPSRLVRTLALALGDLLECCHPA